jgi:hypothetical protein
MKTKMFLIIIGLCVSSSAWAYHRDGSFQKVGYQDLGYQDGYFPYSNTYPRQYSYASVLSKPIDQLPEGYVPLLVNGETVYYANGLFFQRVYPEQKFAVIPPPVGVTVHSIPEGHSIAVLNGHSLYEFNGVYYVRTLEGYKIIPPPASALTGQVIVDMGNNVVPSTY